MKSLIDIIKQEKQFRIDKAKQKHFPQFPNAVILSPKSYKQLKEELNSDGDIHIIFGLRVIVDPASHFNCFVYHDDLGA